MKNPHKFVSGNSQVKHSGSIFCEKCGYISWSEKLTAEGNQLLLQKNIPDCIASVADVKDEIIKSLLENNYALPPTI